ncbi:uncharacterized protein LOC120905086 isoform X1 [Anopheles arabiensis]|uniref:uncharacterized protein LOC120905086 isoform X1 n=1 Tax=Anopheles arabiensis TaxID=7173 RepID=UPI001AAC94EA|nr:uncharacterized protein LOC120905086 isoform X1 [Anopheles arabiensis]
MSPQASSLQIIPLEELCVLRDLYRIEWPRYAYTYYTLDNCYHWRTLARDGELQVVTDPSRDWRSTGTFVLRDCKELFFYTLEATTVGLEWILGRVMKGGDVIVSLVYDSCFREMVDRIVCSLSFAKDSDERMVCYRQMTPCGDVDGNEEQLQREYRFSPVSPDDSEIVEEQWVHSDTVFSKLPTRLINRNPSLGVYDTKDRLVAWCLILVSARNCLKQVDANYTDIKSVFDPVSNSLLIDQLSHLFIRHVFVGYVFPAYLLTLALIVLIIIVFSVISSFFFINCTIY